MKRVISLFSGVGTFDYGFHLAGWETVYLCEWDEKARQVLRARFPGVPITNDVCEVNGADLPDAEVIMFGSPCQDLSIAGKRAGLEGAKSGLFLEAIRIIKEKREATNGRYPAVALWENVPGAFSSNAGRDFAAVIHEFLNCGARDCGWRVLDAQFFGVPQRRRRIFLVADFGGKRAREILFESDSLPRNPVARRTPGQGITGCLTGGAGSSSAGNPDDNRAQAGFLVPVPHVARCKTTRNERQDFETETLIPVAAPAYALAVRGRDGGASLEVSEEMGYALRAGDGGSSRQTLVAQPVTFEPRYYSEREKMGGGPSVKVCGPLKATDGKAGDAAQHVAYGIYQDATTKWAEGISPSLRAPDGGGTRQAVAHPVAFDYKASVQRSPMAGHISPTLEAQTKTAINTPDYQVRRLTPTECERLQGMPDGWTDVNGMADSHRYRFMGNGGAAPVLKWLAERIGAAL